MKIRRTTIFERYSGHLCAYCSQMMGWGRPPTRDHVNPRHAGGTLDPNNVYIVCAYCNQDKGGKSLQAFARWLTDRGDPRAGIVWALVDARPDTKVRDKRDTKRILDSYLDGWTKVRQAEATTTKPVHSEPNKYAEQAKLAIVPYGESMMVMRHGKKAWKAWRDGERDGCDCCVPSRLMMPATLPVEYPNDPKAQAAFEAVYSKYPQMLRV